MTYPYLQWDDVVITDLLWPSITGANREDTRGFEVITQAARTPGTVIVAVTISDATNFPDLEEEARDRGAHIYRTRGALGTTSRRGDFNGLAIEICENLRVKDTTLVKGKFQVAGAGVDAASVFVVCGRDDHCNEALFSFLTALGLKPGFAGAGP